MADIIMAGLGGQGVLTAGKVLINVAAAQGKNVSWTSTYGAAMRGGSAKCSIVVSDEEIGSPYPTKIDILLAMSEDAYTTYIHDVRPGGCAVVNGSMVKDITVPEGVSVYSVNATDEANAVGNARAANLVMLGAMLKGSGLMDAEQFGEGLDAYFGKKGHSDPSNMQCYRAGIETVVSK